MGDNNLALIPNITIKEIKDQIDSGKITLVKELAEIDYAALKLPELLSVLCVDEKQEKFHKEVRDMAFSDDFIEETVSEVGAPKATETKSEFVVRSSSLLRKKLQKKFGVE